MDTDKDLHIRFINACSRGNLDQLKNLLEKHDISELESDPKDSIGLELAFTNCHLKLIHYVLTKDDLNQKITIPLPVLKGLRRYDEKILNYLCKNEEIKHHFNVLENKEHYSIALFAACQKNRVDIMEYLLSKPETKDFWAEKLSILQPICSQEYPDFKIVKLITDQVFSNYHGKREESVANLMLGDCLLESLKKSHMEITRHLIFDMNLQLEDYYRDFVKANYPEAENFFVIRDLNEKLTTDLKVEEQTVSKKPKI